MPSLRFLIPGSYIHGWSLINPGDLIGLPADFYMRRMPGKGDGFGITALGDQGYVICLCIARQVKPCLCGASGQQFCIMTPNDGFGWISATADGNLMNHHYCK